MFHGTVNSHIELPILRRPYTWFSITLMCWAQPGGQDGPLFSYYFFNWLVRSMIENGRFVFTFGNRFFPYRIITADHEVLLTGKWAHVAASYDFNTGNISLYINGHLGVSQIIGRRYISIIFARKILIGRNIYRRDRFKGKIAEIKVYDVALNEAQIQTSIRQGSCTFPVIVVSLSLR